MEIMTRKLVLTFGTPLKTTMDLTVTKPNALLDGAMIKTAMEAIIASNAMGDIVSPDSIQGAKYVIQEIEKVDLDV
ncbi:MAG: DUF2922 domain-containing protein [Cellulosilyticaceae bacterium]